MPKTYAQLLREVGRMHANIAEAHEAVELVRRLARKFQLRAADAFPDGCWPGDDLQPAGETAANVVELARPPYTDGHGNIWNGRGRRPKWLTEALADGRTLRDLMASNGNR